VRRGTPQDHQPHPPGPYALPMTTTEEVRTAADEGGTGPGIVARGVHRTFGTVRAVDGVDLTARRGAVTALVGPNGPGKTTLLLGLMGLRVPDAGTVRVAGFDPVTQGPQARARTGWMPDVFGTWDSLTAREVLTTVAAAYRVPADQAQ